MTIRLRAETAALIAAQAALMARPVTEFVKGGPVPINRRVEILRMRHRDEIVARAVIGRCAADADFGPGGCNQLGCLRKDQAFGHGRRGNMIFVGQAIALVDRKNSELLQERKAALAFARPAAAGVAAVGGGVDAARAAGGVGRDHRAHGQARLGARPHAGASASAHAQAGPLRPEQLHVVIIGAGATGVELSAEYAALVPERVREVGACYARKGRKGGGRVAGPGQGELF